MKYQSTTPSHFRICVCVTLEFIWVCFRRYAHHTSNHGLSSIVVACSTTCSNSVDMMIWFTIWSYLCDAMRTICVRNIFIQIPYFRLPAPQVSIQKPNIAKVMPNADTLAAAAYSSQWLSSKSYLMRCQLFSEPKFQQNMLDVHTIAQSHYAITFSIGIYRCVGANFVMGFSSSKLFANKIKLLYCVSKFGAEFHTPHVRTHCVRRRPVTKKKTNNKNDGCLWRQRLNSKLYMNLMRRPTS